MRRKIPTALLALLLLPATALAGDDNREAAEASLFRGYYLETVKRDLPAAEQAYTEAAWNGEEFPEIGLRAYLGLARTKARQKKEDAAKYLKAAVDWFGRIEDSLPPKTAAALKDEIDDTARLLRGGERRADLDDEIRYQLDRMENAWGAPVGVEAKQKLALYGERAVPILAPALRSTDPQLVRNVADVLAKIGGPAAADALAAAAGDPEVLFPVRLAEGVAGGNGPELRAVKRKLLESDREEVRWAIASGAAIGSVRLPSISRMLYDESERVREKGRYLFAHLGANALAGDDLPTLDGLLEHGNPEVRARALTIAVDAGGDLALKAVRRGLPDKDYDVAFIALSSLTMHRVPFRAEFAPGIVEAAMTILARREAVSDYQEKAGQNAIDLLADHGWPGGRDLVLPLLRFAGRWPAVFDELLRRAGEGDVPAEFAERGYRELSSKAGRDWLARFGTRMTAEALLDIAEDARTDADDALRATAASVLFKCLPPGRWPIVDPWLSDPAESVRRQAAYALVRRDGISPRLDEFLSAHPSQGFDIGRFVLEHCGPDGIRGLLAGLDGESPEAFGRVFQVASRAATDAQVLAALKLDDDEAVRIACIAAGERHLQAAWPLLRDKIHTPAAKNALETIREYVLGMKEYRDLEQSLETDALAKARRLATDKSPAVRRAAALALAAIGDRDAIGVLLDLVTDEDETVRAAAEHALERLAGVEETPGGKERSPK